MSTPSQPPDPGDITGLLIAWSGGEREALDELMPLVYDQLQKIANNYLRKERPDHTLETGCLVHEAYLKLMDEKRLRWRDRAHFFAIASQMMRWILVDHARRYGSAKRGRDFERIFLDDSDLVPTQRPPDLLALDDALKDLERHDPEGARLVELRYFGGLNKEEMGEVLGISSATVTRRWRVVRAWMYAILVKGETHEL